MGEDLGRSLANTNGCAMEDIVQSLYPHSTFSRVGLIDMFIDGVPVEIKSCQKYVKNYENGETTRRRGRFHLREEQHKQLLAMEGDYIFIVQEDQKIIFYARVKANTLKEVKFRNETTLTWTSIFRGIFGGVL